MFDFETKTVRGPNYPQLYNPNLSIGQLILYYLEQTPNKITQTCHDDGISLTCDELRKLSIRVALNLANHGVKPGDIVGLIVKNSTYVIPVVIGAFLHGCKISALDPDFVFHEVEHVLGNMKPPIYFCDHYIVPKIKDMLDRHNIDSKIVSMIEDRDDCLSISDFLVEQNEKTEKNYTPVPLSDGIKTSAVHNCTSGSTGVPKIVSVSHAQLIRDLYRWNVNHDESLFLLTNFHWLSGYIFLIFGIIRGIRRVFTSMKLDSPKIVEIINKNNINHCFLAGTFVTSLVNFISKNPDVKLPTLKSIGSGGSIVPSITRISFKKLFPKAQLLILYGSSEISGIVSGIDNKDDSQYVGKLFPGIEGKVTDVLKRNLNPYQKGDLAFKTPFPFLGYLGEPEKSKMMVDDDGWFYPGDFGYCDEEGNFYVIGRTSDFLNVSGKMVMFDEVENAIMHIKGVIECCVVGIPNETNDGDIPVAVVVTDCENEKLFGKDLLESVNSQFDKLYQISQIFFVDALSKTITGKIKRNEIRETAIQLYLEKNKLLK